MRKTSGEHSERYEYLADKYRSITYSKRLESLMAKKGFPGEVSFLGERGDWSASFYPENIDFPIEAEGDTILIALAHLIEKLLSTGLEQYKSLEENAN